MQSSTDPQKLSRKHFVGGSLLVAGTAIGAGMLALPVVTASAGFVPALFIYLLSWMFMTCTGLLLLELCLKLPPDSNLVSMAGVYLGKPGKLIAWGLYLFLFYCLSMAYISGGASLLRSYIGGTIAASQLIFVLLLGLIVYFGAKIVGRINSALMIGLIIAYFSFVFVGISHVNLSPFEVVNWKQSFAALPVVFTSFSYQGIVPSLTAYMKRDARAVRIAIITGTSLAFVIYLLWNLLIFGIVPLEDLQAASQLGLTAVEPLRSSTAVESISQIGHAFALLAVATSFLGVTLGLFDFLADGLKISKKGMRKVFLAFLTFAPPFAAALYKPDLFIIALGFAGGIGCASLLGLFPIIMVWISRYRQKGHEGPIQLYGGRPVLSFLFAFVLFELLIEVAPRFF
jgi:tyrosine-specific transport protein